MHRIRPVQSAPLPALRAGSILLIVLVVVALLALGAYTFAELMTVEYHAAATFEREVQARALADSGVEYTASLLQKRYQPNSSNHFNDPSNLEGVLVISADSAKGRGRFSIVTGNDLDTSGRSVRFGISDESSKLNLNTLMKLVSGGQLQAANAETMLMAFPNMTVEIADAILDWMDSDTTPMQNGVESEYYQGLSPPYAAKNSYLDSLDELLLVKGVTPQLLFGEDTNHNGILDPNENDGATSLPLDNGDGVLQRGWSAFWTVYSREINLKSDGNSRTNVNQSDLTNLYNQLVTDFDEQTAQFVLAYRVNGPTNTGGGGAGGNGGSGGSSGGTGGGNSNNAQANANTGGGRTTSGGGTTTGGGGSGGAGASAGGRAASSGGGNTQSAGSGGNTNTAGSSGGGNAMASSGGGGSRTASTGGTGAGGGQSAAGGANAARGAGGAAAGSPVLVGGIDISKGASYTITSLFELFGARTQATVNNMQTQMSSPWPSSPVDSMTQALPLVMDKLTLTDNTYIDGRININSAPREVLMALAGLQGMSETIVDGIYAAQSHNTGGTETPADRLNTGWLMVNNLVTSINDLKTLDPLITGRGDVFHVQSVGYFEGGGPMVRVEAVIDATLDPPQIVFQRDLTELGRGFTASLLTTGR